jgi:mannose-6-phosphate isomerase-like protein (cupin superfamily)
MNQTHKDRSNFIEQKSWGEKHNLFHSLYVVIDRLYIKQGGFSSLHSHKFKFNRFFVESGRLLIRMQSRNGHDFNRFIIGPNEKYKVFDICPGKVHQFQALEETIAIEIVYVRALEKDIYRITEGGITSGE